MDKWRILCSTGVLRGNMRKKYQKNIKPSWSKSLCFSSCKALQETVVKNLWWKRLPSIARWASPRFRQWSKAPRRGRRWTTGLSRPSTYLMGSKYLKESGFWFSFRLVSHLKMIFHGNFWTILDLFSRRIQRWLYGSMSYSSQDDIPGGPLKDEG